MTSDDLRLLLLTDSDVFAGTERHLLELAQELGSLGCDVSIGCPDQGVLGKRARACGIRVFPVEKRGRFDFRAVFRLWSALRRKQFNLIHAHNGRTALLAACATRVAGGSRLVLTQHFLAPAHTTLSGFKAFASRKLHRWIANCSAKIIAISEAVRGSMVARRAAHPDKIQVVLNGISDPTKEKMTPQMDVRGKFGVSLDAPLILTSARLDREKGIETLIEAMVGVLAKIPSARCLIAGEGMGRTLLQALLDERGLSASVKLIGFHDDIFSLIAAADVFVLPSPNEPFGLALIEAMALTRPVVAARSGGPREIVSDGESGLLFTPEDPIDLASAILRLLTEQDLALRLASNARLAYLERFTALRMAAQTLSIYQESTPR